MRAPVASVIFAAIIGSAAPAGAIPPPASPEVGAAFAAASDRYFAQENLWNGVYVGFGATNIAVGVALATREDAGVRGASYPVMAIGGVQLALGVIYLALTPGFRTAARAPLARDPAEAVRRERARMRRVEAGFRYYKLIEATAGLTGLVLGFVGAARRNDMLAGAGAGLGVSACLQLVLEHSTHDVAKDYLRALDGLAVGPLSTPGGVGLVIGRAMP